MSTIKVKPKEGYIMRDPETRIPLPPEGAVVPRNNFWIRRLVAGDVSEVKSVSPPPKKKKETPKETSQTETEK